MSDGKFHCPECELVLSCGCKSCRMRYGDKDNMLGFNEDGYTRSCPKCGFTEGGDGWLDIEYDQLKPLNIGE